MFPTGDEIAATVLSVFNSLPAKAKPRQRSRTSDDSHGGVDDNRTRSLTATKSINPNEKREWVPLSGIVVWRESHDIRPVCVSLGTGMRCLPSSKIPTAAGRILHDWHAEILALRAFNYFLLQECAALTASSAHESPFVRRRSDHEADHTPASSQPFALHDDCRIAMYSSEAPCGDASMELAMQAQDDATPWPEPDIAGAADTTAAQPLLDGRAHYSRLGIVRRKPARADAPPTTSKSCSDKLALKQCTSLLSGPTSLLIHPASAYLHALVLPGTQIIRAAVERSFGPNGRMAPVAGPEMPKRREWFEAGYSFRPFEVWATQHEFEWSRSYISSQVDTEAAAGREDHAIPATGVSPSTRMVSPKLVGSNISALWTPYRTEVLIGGRLQGHGPASLGGTSCVSRASIWRLVLDIVRSLPAVPLALEGLANAKRYADLKELKFLKFRRKVKADVCAVALKGWIPNEGDEGFILDSPQSTAGTRK